MATEGSDQDATSADLSSISNISPRSFTDFSSLTLPTSNSPSLPCSLDDSEERIEIHADSEERFENISEDTTICTPAQKLKETSNCEVENPEDTICLNQAYKKAD